MKVNVSINFDEYNHDECLEILHDIIMSKHIDEADVAKILCEVFPDRSLVIMIDEIEKILTNLSVIKGEK